MRAGAQLGVILLLAAQHIGKAEETFKIRFEVAQLNGEKEQPRSFVVEVHPDWAPLGAARLREIVEKNVWDKARFFRVVPGFVAQWGIPGKPSVAEEWRAKKIKDDPVKPGIGNKRGYLTFAKSGEDTRTTQVFINFGDNTNLDSMGFPPVGVVVEGMEESVDNIYSGYEEKPDQGEIQSKGNTYLKKNFPRLSYIKSVSIVKSNSSEL